MTKSAVLQLYLHNYLEHKSVEEQRDRLNKHVKQEAKSLKSKTRVVRNRLRPGNNFVSKDDVLYNIYLGDSGNFRVIGPLEVS